MALIAIVIVAPEPPRVTIRPFFLYLVSTTPIALSRYPKSWLSNHLVVPDVRTLQVSAIADSEIGVVISGGFVVRVGGFVVVETVVVVVVVVETVVVGSVVAW